MSLYQIIAGLVRQTGRASVELPRGLWLVHYQAEGDQPARLVAGRHLNRPSDQELAIVRDTLLDVLDGIESRVAYGFTPWAKTENNGWHGYSMSWQTTSIKDAFSPDPDRADLIRIAIERREERIQQRREREQREREGSKGRARRSAASGPRLI